MSSEAFRRLDADISEARREMGLQSQPNIGNGYIQNFSSQPDFGNPGTAQLVKAQAWLKEMALVLDLSAVTTVSGTPGWCDDLTNAIQTITMTYAGNQIALYTGQQLSIVNQKRASISGLASIEECTLLHASLAERRTAAASPFTAIINLPLPFEDAAIPYMNCAADIFITVQLNPTNLCLESGTGTASVLNASLLCQYLQTPPLGTPIDLEFVNQVASTGGAGRDVLYREIYMQTFPIANGQTSCAVNLSQLRGPVKELLYALIPTASLTTNGAYQPRNFLPVTTQAFQWNGQNWLTQQPVSAEVYRRHVLPNSGVLNFVDEELYGFVADGGMAGDDFKPIDRPTGGGLEVGSANVGAPLLSLTFPNPGAAATLCVFVEVWNALKYVAAGPGSVNFSKLTV